MNNRFEKMIVKKLTQDKEFKYLDNCVYEIFTEFLLPKFIEPDYDRHAEVFRDNQIQRKAKEKTSKEFVDRVVASVKAKEKSTRENVYADDEFVK